MRASKLDCINSPKFFFSSILLYGFSDVFLRLVFLQSKNTSLPRTIGNLTLQLCIQFCFHCVMFPFSRENITKSNHQSLYHVACFVLTGKRMKAE